VVAVEGDLIAEPVPANDDRFPAELRGARRHVPPDRGSATNEGHGVLRFKVEKPGWVYLTGSWNYQGNSGGNWMPERLMPEDLEAQGWRNLDKAPWDENSVLFKKFVKEGESYRLRVNKYGPPILYAK
jgi:hypothetical protein